MELPTAQNNPPISRDAILIDATVWHDHPAVAFPSFGTGFGGVSYDEAARQMAAAYRHYRNSPHRLDWDWVIERQKSICYDGRKQVVRS